MSRRNHGQAGAKGGRAEERGGDKSRASGRAGANASEPSSFAEIAGAMSGMRRADHKPMAPRPKPAPPKPVRAGSKQKPGRDGTVSSVEPRVSKAELRRLRAGEIRPQSILDLHASNRHEAHTRLCHAVLRVAESGQRCLLVIHGKGFRSAGGEGVLKRCLPEWLAKPPLRDRVVASAPAQPADGGAGATLLLIR